MKIIPASAALIPAAEHLNIEGHGNRLAGMFVAEIKGLRSRLIHIVAADLHLAVVRRHTAAPSGNAAREIFRTYCVTGTTGATDIKGQ